MKLRCLIPLTGCIGLLLSGCTSYPQAMTKKQWEALSPEKQALARMVDERDRKNYDKYFSSTVDSKQKMFAENNARDQH